LPYCCALHAQATKLKHQLSYEHRRDLAADVAVAKEELKKVQDTLEQLEEQARAAAEAADSVEQELAAEVCAATGSPSKRFLRHTYLKDPPLREGHLAMNAAK